MGIYISGWLNLIFRWLHVFTGIQSSEGYAEVAGIFANKRLEVLSIDAGCANYTGAPVLADCDPDDVACIYFTSGSTGRPKGVCDTD